MMLLWLQRAISLLSALLGQDDNRDKGRCLKTEALQNTGRCLKTEIFFLIRTIVINFYARFR
jgi:hypothetical protein